MSEGNYPVSRLSQAIDIGDKSLSDCYPHIIEFDTDDAQHAVPRVIFRAFLPHRLKEDEVFNFVVNDLAKSTVDDVKSTLNEMNFMPSSLYFIYVGKYKTLKTPVKTALTKRGFVPNDIVNRFFDQRIDKQPYKDEGDFMQVFADAENKVAIAIGSVSEDYLWNVIAAINPRVIPWYYGVESDFKESPLTADEITLARAVDKGEEAFVAAAQKIYNETDVADKVSAIRFKNMYKGVKEKLIRQYTDNIANWNAEFARFESQIQETAKKIRDASIMKSSLENSEEDDGKSMADFFTKRSNLSIKRWEGNALIFTVASMASPFNYDAAESDLKRSGHAIYRGRDNCDLTQDQAKKLLKAVFIDRVIKLPLYSNYRLSLSEASIRLAMNEPAAPKFAGYTPHPHHLYYGCTGNNLSQAATCMRDGNYVGAVSQVIGSTATITFADETVMAEFGNKILWNISEKPYMLPDGSFVNCKDAYKWLEENESEDEE